MSMESFHIIMSTTEAATVVEPKCLTAFLKKKRGAALDLSANSRRRCVGASVPCVILHLSPTCLPLWVLWDV